MTDATKLRLDLPLVLPGVDDVRDRCVARLIDLLAGRPGISEAHIVGPDGPAPELCIHYDPATLSLSLANTVQFRWVIVTPSSFSILNFEPVTWPR